MPNSPKKVRSPFRRVLFASNFSAGFEGALQTALQLCQINKASLRLLHVHKIETALGHDGELLTETNFLEKSALRLLRQMKDRAVGLGVSCTTRLETGVPSEKILAEIPSAQIDLVILGTSEPRGSKRLAFGPTAEQVMRKAKCPIMIVGPVATDLPTQTSSEGPVIFATDFHSVTRRAIHLAVAYCKSTDLRLHCLHVLPRTLRPAPGDQTLPELLTCALKHLVATSPLPIDDSVYHVSFGSEVSNAVVEYARQQSASMIVLGVRRASILSPDDPLPIVYRMIAEAHCPVITILFDTDPDPE